MRLSSKEVKNRVIVYLYFLVARHDIRDGLKSRIGIFYNNILEQEDWDWTIPEDRCHTSFHTSLQVGAKFPNTNYTHKPNG